MMQPSRMEDLIMGCSVSKKFADIPLLNGLDREDTSEVIKSGKFLQFKAGDHVIRIGEKGEELFVILTGSVRAEANIGGIRQVLAGFKAGDIFGEIAFVSKTLRTADVIAAEDLEVFVISREYMEKLALCKPKIASRLLLNLSVILCNRLANTTRLWMDSEYENILALFQSLAMETKVEKVFNKFSEALAKALPGILSVQFITEKQNLLWTMPGTTTGGVSLAFLKDINEMYTDKKRALAVCPVKVEGRSRAYVVLMRRKEQAEMDRKELNLFLRVSTQLYLVIDRILLNEEIKEMATIDPLTGLYNRRIFQEELAKEVEIAVRYGSPLSLLIADLDYFKSVNDSYGHLAGDAVLREIAALFTRSLRKIDVICRYGGEEFAILLPRTTIEGARVIAERLRKAVDAQTIEYGKNKIHVTISLGASMYTGGSSEDFIRKTDEAVYKSKADGRNRVTVIK